MLVPKKAPTMPKPTWHPPWKLYRVGIVYGYSILEESIDTLSNKILEKKSYSKDILG